MKIQKVIKKFNNNLDKIEFAEGVISTLTSQLPHNESEFLAQLNETRSSKVLEATIQMATEKHIRFLFNKFPGRFFLLSTGKFSSFLLQKMLLISQVIITNENPEEEDDLPLMSKMFNNMMEELDGHWHELAYHKYGSHILRTIFQILMTENFDKLNEILDNLLEKIDKNEWIYNETITPIMVFLLESKNDQVREKIFNIFFKDIKESKKEIKEALGHPAASRVMDTLLKSCDDDLLLKLYAKIWKRNLIVFSTSKTANYSVSILMNRLSKAKFEECFDILKSSFSKHLESYRGIILTILDNCIKHETKQEEFIQHFTVLNDEKCLETLLLPNGNDQLDRHGCNIITSLLKLENTDSICDKLLETTWVEDLSFDKNGSLLVEQLIPKRPKDCLKLLLPHMKDLALNVYGCRVLQTIFKILDSEGRVEIAKSLITHPDIQNNKFGLIVWNNCKLTEFEKDKTKDKRVWKTTQERNQKRKREFEKIIEQVPEKSVETKKDKKKQKGEEVSKEGNLDFIFSAIQGTKGSKK